MAKKNKKRTLRRSLRDELFYRRYLKKDQTGKVIETVDQMFRRVANAIAEEERKYGATDEEKYWLEKGYNAYKDRKEIEKKEKKKNNITFIAAIEKKLISLE